MRVLKYRKAGALTDKLPAIVLGAIIIVVVIAVFIWPAMKGGKSVGSIIGSCDAPKTKCACFFKGNVCPGDITIKEHPLSNKLSGGCPPDTLPCTKDNFADLLEKAQKQAKGKTGSEKSKSQGRCCHMDTEPSSRHYKMATT
jgi:hypothetical protein